MLGDSFERRAYWFVLKTAKVFLFPQESRNRMVSTFLMVASHVRDSLEDKSILFSFKKGLPRLFSLAKKKIYLGAHLKEELTDLFWTVPGYSYSHKQRRKTMENTLLMVNIIPICKRYLEGKSLYSFFSFLSNSRKKIEPGLCLQQEENMLALNLQVFLLTNRQKNHPLVKRTIKYVLFNSCSYKNSCFSELAYNSSVPVLKLKRCSPRFWFWFCAFAFKGLLLFYITYPSRFVTNGLLFTGKILVF